LKPPIGQIEKVSIVQQVRQFTKSPRFNLCKTPATSANTARAVSSMSALQSFATVKSSVGSADKPDLCDCGFCPRRKRSQLQHAGRRVAVIAAEAVVEFCYETPDPSCPFAAACSNNQDAE